MPRVAPLNICMLMCLHRVLKQVSYLLFGVHWEQWWEFMYGFCCCLCCLLAQNGSQDDQIIFVFGTSSSTTMSSGFIIDAPFKYLHHALQLRSLIDATMSFTSTDVAPGYFIALVTSMVLLTTSTYVSLIASPFFTAFFNSKANIFMVA